MEIHPEGKLIDNFVIKESQNIQNINIKRKKNLAEYMQK